MANGNGEYTKVQGKIMDLLADLRPHRIDEFNSCLWDEESVNVPNAVKFHVSNIRKVINPRGDDIVGFRSLGQLYYQLVRIMASANDGRR